MSPDFLPKEISEDFEPNIQYNSEEEDKNVGYGVIFKNKSLLRTQIIYCFTIAYLYLAYNGILFGLNYLQGSLYTNSLVTSIAETSAYGVSSKSYVFCDR